MSIDAQKLKKQAEAIKIQEEKNKKKKAAYLYKQKEAIDYAFRKLGEIYFNQFKVEYNESDETSKSSLLTMLANDKVLKAGEKKKLSDLINNDVLKFKKPKPRSKKKVEN